MYLRGSSLLWRSVAGRGGSRAGLGGGGALMGKFSVGEMGDRKGGEWGAGALVRSSLL